MKSLIFITSLLLACFSIKGQSQDSIRKEIETFENTVFKMELSNKIDTNAEYKLLYEWMSMSRVKRNGSSKNKKGNNYFNHTDKEIMISGNEIQNHLDTTVSNTRIFNHKLLTKKDKWFEYFTSHYFDLDFHRWYFAVFENQYMIIRKAYYDSNITQTHEGPPYNVVWYLYYERIK